jgi:hypothetical protein
VHELVCADDGIDRTDFAAPGAADTLRLVYQRERSLTRGGNEWRRIAPQQVRKALHRVVAARRAEVYRRLIFDDGCSIRAAAGIAALSALCLR